MREPVEQRGARRQRPRHLERTDLARSARGEDTPERRLERGHRRLGAAVVRTVLARNPVPCDTRSGPAANRRREHAAGTARLRRIHERATAARLERFERLGHATLGDLEHRELLVRPAPFAPERGPPLLVEDAGGEPLGFVRGALEKLAGLRELAAHLGQCGAGGERQVAQARRAAALGDTRERTEPGSGGLGRAARDQRAHLDRGRARIALAIARGAETMPRGGDQCGRGAVVPFARPQRRESKERLADPDLVSFSVERRERALDREPGRLGLPEAPAGQRAEQLGLRGLVAQSQQAARDDRFARLLERVLVRTEPEQDLGAIQPRQRGERRIAARLGLVAHVREPGQRQLVLQLQEVEVGEVVLGGQRLVRRAGRHLRIARGGVVLACLVAAPEQRQAVADVGADHERARLVVRALE